MNHVTLVIPTRNRLGKLRQTLNTVPDVPWLHVLVICDGDSSTYDALRRQPRYPRVRVELLPSHSGSVAARNAFIPECQDGVLYGVDDIDFLPGSIEAAFGAFNERFPDDDGVVGFCQVGHHNWHKSGVALLGRRFLDRYPGRQPFFPGYWHFAAQEIAWLADKVGRFHQCERAEIRHHHPDLAGDHLKDQTHREARKHGERDRALRRERQREGLIWGSSHQS